MNKTPVVEFEALQRGWSRILSVVLTIPRKVTFTDSERGSHWTRWGQLNRRPPIKMQVLIQMLALMCYKILGKPFPFFPTSTFPPSQWKKKSCLVQLSRDTKNEWHNRQKSVLDRKCHKRNSRCYYFRCKIRTYKTRHKNVLVDIFSFWRKLMATSWA